MASKKLIVVFGATGAQGGSVVRALIKDAQYKVRGVTRNPASQKAKELQSLGIETVKGDLSDVASVRNAMKGAYGAFVVTAYWTDMNEEREVKEGISAADAAKEAGVQHLIFSGHESCLKPMGVPCPHFDGKARIGEHIKSLGIGHTIVKYAVYYENFLNVGIPSKIGDGLFQIDYAMEDFPFDMICTSEAGECVHQILNNPDKYKGQEIGFSSERKTIGEFTEDLNKVFNNDGKKFVVTKKTTETMRQEGDPTGMASTFEFYKAGHGIRDVALTRQLNPSIPTLKQWLIKNKEALTAVLDSI